MPEPADVCLGLAPIWTLPACTALIEASGARRLVQLSSTSRFTKAGSRNTGEAATARRLAEAEAALEAWATRQGIAWTILRPTMIYGDGRDANVAEIARFIRRFGFFPLFGRAAGLRQPVAAADVAGAVLAAAGAPAAENRAYDIAGGETLSYRRMVERIFTAEGRRPVTPTVPLAAFRLASAALRLLPRHPGWTAEMAERMNRDLVFDNGAAVRDFGYAPGPFRPEPLPRKR
ncbi:MAG TPA: NAD-dependent epimerase/dehydratase family protein [Devosiaceae bacterium]|nr:NAD-dependent epimerase/dehydratase family protein [Devosiaceae bacterium]